MEVLTKRALIHPINQVLITTIRAMERITKGVKVDITAGTRTTARISLQLRACLIVLYFVNWLLFFFPQTTLITQQFKH